VSRYDLFRRRIAPIAFFLVIGLIAKDSCEKDQRTHTTVELAFGAAKPRVREVAVDVVVDGDTITTFRRTAQPDAVIGPCRFELAVPGDHGELRIDVELSDAHHQLSRRFYAVDGGTIQVTIRDDELR
jgi:hypothetical protein